MNYIAIRLIVFVCVFGAALLGLFLRAILPQQHLSPDSKDTVRLGMGLIATMAALVLGLLVSSAKNFYDTQSSELTEMSAKTVLLDRVLAHYGIVTSLRVSYLLPFRNPATGYRPGQAFHFNVAIGYRVKGDFTVGLTAYSFNQFTDEPWDYHSRGPGERRCRHVRNPGPRTSEDLLDP